MSEIVAALEMLDHLGVTRGDLARMRSNNGNNVTATSVSEAFLKTRTRDVILEFNFCCGRTGVHAAWCGGIARRDFFGGRAEDNREKDPYPYKLGKETCQDCGKKDGKHFFGCQYR